MDREAIVAKLVEIRDSANAQGYTEIAEFFSGVEDLASPKVGGKVIAALTWLEGLNIRDWVRSFRWLR